MKYFITIAIILLVSCSTFRSHVHYDKAHQNFLSHTIRQLDLSTKVIPSIPAGSMIVVRSMEHPNTLDGPVLNMIEDYIVSEFIKSNFKVLERDLDVVEKLVRERSKFSIKEDSLSEHTFYSTHLKSARYILAYRILECGIRTTPINRKKLYREGLVRLHMRLIDAKTGEIKIVRNVASLQNDEITNHMKTYYENFHYNFFKHEFPLQDNKEDQE